MSVAASWYSPKVRSTSRKMKRKRWADGRWVAILPDVPGKWFNPEDSVFLKTPEEQKNGSIAFRVVLDKMLRDGKPSWYEPESAPEQTTSSKGKG